MTLNDYRSFQGHAITLTLNISETVGDTGLVTMELVDLAYTRRTQGRHFK